MKRSFAVFALLLLGILSAYPTFANFSSYTTHSSKTISKPLKWNTETIPIQISSSLLNDSANIRSQNDILETITRSFSAWEAVSGIRFELTVSDKTSISNAGESGDGVNLLTIARTSENLLPFSGDNFNSAGATRIFYDRRGNISEVDIVLNPNQLFSTDGTFGTFDLESTLTHEIGHLLGLDHSMIIGSTMYPNQGQNGLFSAAATVQRVISISDEVSIRTLYPERFYSDECCASVSGLIRNTLQKKDSVPVIWIEEFESGRTVTAVATDNSGRYNVTGLRPGHYRILLGISDGASKGISLFDESEFEVEANESIRIDGSIRNDFLLQSPRMFGLNGQLSTVALPIDPGAFQTIYISGSDIHKDRLEMLSTSPHLILTPGDAVFNGDDRYDSVLSFGAEASKNILPGNYSIYLWAKDRSPRVFLGAISIR